MAEVTEMYCTRCHATTKYVPALTSPAATMVVATVAGTWAVAQHLPWWGAVIAFLLGIGFTVQFGQSDAVEKGRLCGSCGSPEIVDPRSPRAFKERETMRKWIEEADAAKKQSDAAKPPG